MTSTQTSPPFVDDVQAQDRRRLAHHLLMLGGVLVVVGVGFFIAANWSAMLPIGRMAVVALGMLGAVGFALTKRRDSRSGRLALACAGLLIGPLLAVYGQTYQTGADDWQLFAGWTALITVFVVTSRFWGLFVVQWLLLHVAVVLRHVQLIHVDVWESMSLWLALGALNAVACAVVWGLRRRGTLDDNVGTTIISHLTQVLALVTLLLPAVVFVVDDRAPDHAGWGVVALLLFGAGMTAVQFRKSTLGLTFTGMTAWCFASAVAGDALFSLFGFNVGEVFLLGVILVFNALVFVAFVVMGRAPRNADDRASQETKSTDHDDLPLLPQLFAAGCVWLGSLFVVAAVAALDVVPPPLFTGVLLFAVGVVGSRFLPAKGFLRLLLMQGVLLTAFGGAFFGLWGLAEWHVDELFAVLFVSALSGVALVGGVRILRVSAGVAFVLVWTAYTAEQSVTLYVWVLGAFSALVWLSWLLPSTWLPQRLHHLRDEALSDLRTGATLATASTHAVWAFAAFKTSASSWGLVVPLSLCVLLFLWQRRADFAGHPHRVASAVAVVLVLGLSLHSPPLLFAAGLYAAALQRQSHWHTGLSLLLLGVCTSGFYYALDVTLIMKSLWVIAAGALLLIWRLVVRPAQDANDSPPVGLRPDWRLVLTGGLLVVSVVTGLSVQKELVLRHGTRVVLPLAPKDPRSLMQGDYMRLRYRLANRIPRQGERDGRIVVTLDHDDVATFSRELAPGESPTDGEVVMHIRRRHQTWRRGGIRIGAESFLFEEGRAAHYEAAKFGVVRVSSSGTVVLQGLLDENRQPL